MTKLIYIVVIFSFLMGCQEKPDVIKTKSGLYGSRAGEFLIKFPDEPKVYVFENKIGFNEFETISFTHKVGDWHQYSVTYNDFPENIISNWESESLFDQTAKNIASQFDNFVIQKREVENNPEFEKSIYYKLVTQEEYKSYQLHVRMIKAGNRIYSIYFLAIKKLPPAEEIETFMNSFKLYKSS